MNAMKATEVTRFEHKHSRELGHFVRGAADKAGCIVLSRGSEESTILAPTVNHMQEYLKAFPLGQVIKKLPKLMSGLHFYAIYDDDNAYEAEQRGSTRLLSATTKKNKDRAHDPKLLSGVDIVFWGDYNEDRSYSGGKIPGLGTVMCGSHKNRTDYVYVEYSREYLETMCKRISFDVAVKHIPLLLAGDRLDEEEKTVMQPEETTIGVPL